MKVWTLVQERHPDWTLNVYGNGVLKPFYEKIIVPAWVKISYFVLVVLGVVAIYTYMYIYHHPSGKAFLRKSIP